MSDLRKRVLVIDDSPVMRELFRIAFMRRPEVEVDHAPDGLAGMQALRGSGVAYDLVFLDLNMPIMDGMKLLGRLAEEPPANTPVVAVVTTEASPEVEEQARQLGAGYFLRKPVTRRELERVLDEVIGPD